MPTIMKDGKLDADGLLALCRQHEDEIERLRADLSACQRLDVPAAKAAHAAIVEALDDPSLDRETAQTILDLLNPLHSELDRQTYDQKVRDNFDAPADSEYNVDITARMERDLSQAVSILEDRLRQAKAD